MFKEIKIFKFSKCNGKMVLLTFFFELKTLRRVCRVGRACIFAIRIISVYMFEMRIRQYQC